MFLYVDVDSILLYVIEHYRPISIAANGDDRRYIADFAEKLGIKLVEAKRLAMIGSLMADIMEMINSKQLSGLKDLLGDFPL